MPKIYRYIFLTVLLGTVIFPFILTSADPVKIFDPADMDITAKPCDDFYQYAVGGWLKNNPIPGEYTQWGSFEQLADTNLKELKELLEIAAADKNAAPGSVIQKIGDFYTVAVDEAKIEAEGLKPLEEDFKRIDNIRDNKDLQKLIAYFHGNVIRPLFRTGAAPDPKNSRLNIVWLYQDGMGLPDRDYYLEDNDRSKSIREEYLNHVTRMFQLLNEPPEKAAISAKTVMTIETRLAKASMSRLDMRNPKSTYNKKNLEELVAMAPNFDFVAYFKNIGIINPRTIENYINVGQPKFFQEISVMMKDVSLEDWKPYLRWHLIRSSAPYLSSAFVKERFNFYDKFLNGQKELKSNWKRAINEINRAIGEAVGQFYVKKYFPPEAKTRAYEMVMNLKKAFAQRIDKLAWMSDETKKKALAKLESFGVKIGYPDKWIDYSLLEVKRDSYIANVLRSNRFNLQRILKKVGQPVDREEWNMYPQIVNAFYNPLMNEIMFPAGILQPPFFDFKADDAVNYGAIGAAIGHEMTHGFDDSGRQYDKDGNMNDWWTKEDEEKFKARTEILIQQYSNYVVIDDAHMDGKLTLGENIADLGGLSIAYDALMSVLPENPAKIDGFTPQQRFFLSWARVWRENIHKEALLLGLKTDVHPPSKFRTIGPLSNLPTFYQAFDVQPGAFMYRPEKEQANIW
ncbi:MAG: M13 family metallopeptidase [Acidobacteria bacterium]|nr:M13 family metallopeptidase [Acidobacteriota bacterium]